MDPPNLLICPNDPPLFSPYRCHMPCALCVCAFAHMCHNCTTSFVHVFAAMIGIEAKEVNTLLAQTCHRHSRKADIADVADHHNLLVKSQEHHKGRITLSMIKQFMWVPYDEQHVLHQQRISQASKLALSAFESSSVVHTDIRQHIQCTSCQVNTCLVCLHYMLCFALHGGAAASQHSSPPGQTALTSCLHDSLTLDCLVAGPALTSPGTATEMLSL